MSGTLTDSCIDSKESFSIGLWFFQCSIYKGDSGKIFPGVSRVNKETKTSCFLVTQRPSDKGDSADFSWETQSKLEAGHGIYAGELWIYFQH